MKKAIVSVFMIAIVLILACSENNSNECASQPDISDIEISIKIDQLHNQLLNVESQEELRSFLKKNPILTQFFFKPSQYPDENKMVEVLFDRFNNAHIDTLLAEVNTVFGDLSQLEAELERAYKHLKYYYPETRVPKIKAVATGLAHDMYVSDSLIIIGLDYYLGKDAKYRPINMFDYMLRRYQPEYIVPSIMLLEGISSTHNKTDLSDNTILADMIAYGKSFYFAKQMMPCTPDSILIWYNSDEIVGAAKNQDIIWAHFLEEELLFETNHMIKKKYIDPRPKTYEIGDKAPGRIGTWLGWQIVKAYMDEEEASLQELMEVQDPKEIFNKSKYRPERP